MKKFFWPVYTIVVFSIVIWFALHENIVILRFISLFLIIYNHWKFIASHIDRKIVIDVEYLRVWHR